MESYREYEVEKFKRLINKFFVPNVYVCASQKAKQIFHSNLLTPAEFLRPFSYLSEPTTIKYGPNDKEKQLVISDLHVNFLDAEEFDQPKKDHVENRIKEIITNCGPDKLDEKNFSTSPSTLCEQLKNMPMPWFDQVVEAVFSYTKFHYDINFIDQPCAIFYILSSKEDDPKQALKSLINEHYNKINGIFVGSPSDCQRVPKIVLLVHEFISGSVQAVEDAQKIINAYTNEYPSYMSKLIIIGTSEDNNAYKTWEGFTYHKYYYPSQQIDLMNNDITNRGKNIAKNDRDFIKTVIFEIFNRAIIPYFESKLKALDSFAKSKKSIGSSIKKFFGGSNKTEINEKLIMTQDEANIRNLADALFLLEDYDGAYSNYKFISSDIKAKSSALYANIQEMMNICLLLNPEKTKKDTSFRKCYELYMEKWDFIKFAIRTTIFHISHGQINNTRDDAVLLLDSSKKFKEYLNLIHCLYYEQFALSYLKTEPVWPRKYAFSMILSGHTYMQSGLRKHGQRCYQLANLIYRKVDWNLIQEHVNKTIGTSIFNGGEPLLSIKYFRKALENMKQLDSAEKHSQFIKEVLNAISHVQAQKVSNELTPEEISSYYEEIINFPFPVIAEEAFDITLNDDYFNFINERKTNKIFVEGISSQEILLNRDSDQLWYNMGRKLECFIQNVTAIKKLEEEDEISLKIMDCVYVSDKNQLLKDNPRESYINEEILISVRVDNPYKIQLELKDFRLEYELTSLDNSPDQVAETLESAHENFILGELEQKFVEIRMKPSKEGLLKVKGVKWTLDCIEGRYFFNFKNASKKRRKHHINEIKIINKEPKPRFTLKNLKNQLFFGEFNKFTLNVENLGEDDIANIYLINSYSELTGFEFKGLGSVSSNSSADFDLVLRGYNPSVYEIRFLLKVIYKSGKSRYGRIVFPLEVQSSFIPRYFTSTCFDKRLIGLQFEEIWTHSLQKQIGNLDKETYGLFIDHIILLGKTWKIVKQDNLKPIYKKSQNFLNIYIERNDDKKDLELPLSLNPETNLASFSDKEVLTDMKNLLEFYEITFNKTAYPGFSQLTKDNEEMLSFALMWHYQAENMTLHGINFLYKVSLNNLFHINPIANRLMINEMPLQIKIVTPKKVKHNFEGNSTCFVDVEMKMTNISGGSSLSFKVEAVSADHQLQPMEISGTKYFVWEGITEIDISNLQPFETKSIKITATFFEKGVYDVSRFRFSFYQNRKTKEYAKDLNNKDILNTGLYDTIKFNSEKDNSLLEIA